MSLRIMSTKKFRIDQTHKEIIGLLTNYQLLPLQLMRKNTSITSGRRLRNRLDSLQRWGLVEQVSERQDNRLVIKFKLTEKGTLFALLLPQKYRNVERLPVNHHSANPVLKVAYALIKLGNQNMLSELIESLRSILGRNALKALITMDEEHYDTLITKDIERWYHLAIRFIMKKFPLGQVIVLSRKSSRDRTRRSRKILGQPDPHLGSILLINKINDVYKTHINTSDSNLAYRISNVIVEHS